MSRPAFTVAQKKLKTALLEKFKTEGKEATLAEIHQLKSKFAQDFVEATAKLDTLSGDEKRAQSILARQAKKSGQIVVVVEKTIATLTKSPEVKAAEKAARLAKKAAATPVVEAAPEVATEPALVPVAPVETAAAVASA